MAKGANILITGVPGSGKTTLFKIISKQIEPDSGTVKIGDTVELSYVDQGRELDGVGERVVAPFRDPYLRNWQAIVTPDREVQLAVGQIGRSGASRGGKSGGIKIDLE